MILVKEKRVKCTNQHPRSFVVRKKWDTHDGRRKRIHNQHQVIDDQEREQSKTYKFTGGKKVAKGVSCRPGRPHWVGAEVSVRLGRKGG